MGNNDDETRTARASSANPAFDATVPADTSKQSSSKAGRAPNEVSAATTIDRIGRYIIDSELGSGGMGVVYRARDPELDRELAIKVVRPGSATERSQERLLAEARAMAKLRHPAVVPVFDVGTTADGVFIVMPLIKGGTLYEWMRERRPWRDVVSRFLAAGRGLAAAHDAGLVHRDFKPRNVLVSEAGEVLVADFGIAARTDTVGDTVPDPSTPGTAHASSVAGTPAYMAPEQAEGVVVDARADQYSFCIAFWEALCSQRPTEAETRTAGALARRGEVPKGVSSGAPTWLLRALSRGFAQRPDERWPSMNALLSFIERRRARPRRLAAVAAGAMLVAASAGAIAFGRGSSNEACPDPTGRLSAVWTPQIRAKIQAAFAATGVAYANDSFRRIASVLDAYANDWRAMHIRTCRAGRIERTQSSELYDRRMMCLDRHLDVMRAQTSALQTVSASGLPRARDVVGELPPLTECEDTAALLDQIPAPTNARLRALVLDLERRIHDTDVYALRNKPKDVLKEAIANSAQAHALGHIPTIVMALRSLAHVQEIGRVPGDVTLRELATVASTAKDDAAVTEAWSRLIWELARQQRFAEARALEPVAEAALTRAGETPALVFRVYTSLGGRANFESDMELATKRFEKALAAAQSPQARTTATKNLAVARLQAGDFKRGLELLETALKTGEEAYGPQHPAVADVLVLIAQGTEAMGDPSQLPRAKSLLDRALEIRVGAFGESSPPVANVLSAMATLATSQGDYAQAEANLRRAIPILEKNDEAAELAIAVRKLADAIAYQKGIVEARSTYEHALALSEAVGGKKDVEYVAASLNFGSDLVDLEGGCVQARAYAANAIEVLGASDPALAIAYQINGKCDLADGLTDSGFDWLQRGVDLCANGCWTGALEDMEYFLGKKLHETGRDRKRGIALVKKARDGFKAIGRDEAAKEADDWLAKHAK